MHKHNGGANAAGV